MKYLLLIIVLLFLGCSNKEENIYIPQKNYKYSSTQNNQTIKYKTYKLKPYKVLGKWYYPRYVNIGEKFRGISSWYGSDFHGKLTANGEIYNMYDFTAANKIMPLGTKIKVTNLNNNKSVIVRINDRGPFVKDRILDLSYAAGKKIGIDKTGTTLVEIEVLSTPYSSNSNKYTQKNKNIKTNFKKNGKIKIQIGAFKNLKGAKIVKKDYLLFNKPIYIKKINNIYKVFMSGFNNYIEAKNFKESNGIKGFIVK